MEPIRFDPQGAMVPQHGLAAEDLAALAPRLAAARDEVLSDARLWAAGGPVPADKVPLDAGFVHLPERILEDYRARRQNSELGQVLATARRLAEEVDRVVLLGIGGSYMGARALFEACCHPYHNELPRAERGGRPRLYFEGNNLDNDALASLLDLLPADPRGDDPARQWAVVVVSKSGGTLETAVALRILLERLRQATGGSPERLAGRVVPVTGVTGRLDALAAALGCPEVFRIPEGVGGRFSVFSPVGLLPAALLGLDVVALLEGAAAMNRRFAEEPPGRNPALDYLAVAHRLEVDRGCTIRVLSTWGKGLEAVGLWYDQLLAESLGKLERGATPLTVVNTRDLHSRGQQHQEGRRDKLLTNLTVGQARRDPLAIGESRFNQDELNRLARRTLPEALAAAAAGTNQAYRDVNRPTVELHLPRLDEGALGQLLQMLMLATVAEGRLIGINPYGQPGVEAYKKNMNARLRGGD